MYVWIWMRLTFYQSKRMLYRDLTLKKPHTRCISAQTGSVDWWEDVSADIHLSFSLTWLCNWSLKHAYNHYKDDKAQYTLLSTKQWERGPKMKSVWIINCFSLDARTNTHHNVSQGDICLDLHAKTSMHASSYVVHGLSTLTRVRDLTVCMGMQYIHHHSKVRGW